MIISSRFAAAVLAFSVLASGLTGCGSSGRTDGAGATAAATNEHDRLVKFAQCLRKHGVDVDDPRPGSGLQINSGLGNKEKVDAATKACRQYDPIGDVESPDAARQDRDLKMAQCLRRHGVRVADPKAGQGLQIQGGPGNQANVDKAMKACLKEVPSFLPGAGG